MTKNLLLSMCLATCFAAVSTETAAQQLSTTDARNTYEMGETVGIKYEGAQTGDKIIFFHNLSIMPLAEQLVVEQTEGVYEVPPVLQPGDYWALLVRENQTKAQLNFKIADLPIDGKYRVMLISDPHLMSPDLIIDPNSSSYEKMLSYDRKLTRYSYDIFLAYLDTIRAIHPDLLLIPGDLTKEGELLSHQLMAEKLQGLLDEGIPSLVIPGNHDMECSAARYYDYDGSHKAESITTDQFAEIYRNFGYGEGADRDPNSLSYVCEPIPGLVMICIDDIRVPSRGLDTSTDVERGRITQPTIDWVVSKADEAVRQNKRVLAMLHHQMVNQYGGQSTIYTQAVTEHGDSLARIFAGHGIKAVFTGHMHVPNAAKIWSESREDSMYCISSASSISYPSHYRMLLFDEDLSRMKVVSREVRSTSKLPNLQFEARKHIAETLPVSVEQLTTAYRSTLDNMLQQFQGIPEFDNAIADIPESNAELAQIAYQAFGPTLEKVVFTSAEGNENLKGCADEIIEQLNADCVTACDLIFDNQNADTRAFLTTIFQLMLMEEAESVLRSMLTDTSFLGTADENQTDDLYLEVALTDNGSGISTALQHKTEGTPAFYTLSGVLVGSDEGALPKGVYIRKQGDSVSKILVK